MQALPLGRSSLAQTALVSSLTLVAVALLGAVLAYWTWAWFAPRAEMRVEAAAAQSGSVASAGAIFGTAPRNQVAAPTGIAIKLLGVVAASGGRRGYAVVQLEAKQVLAVHEGEDVAPGIRLAEVHAEHVILERNGLRETLALPERTVSAGSAPRSAQAAVSVAPRAARPVVRRAGGSRRRPAETE
ncbi:MAG: general secretion pathway protein [Burkholderiales bacterium]|nr:general secretion pathway protein [Burkholderiales bacterium]